jgi:hypothetical protein
MSSTPGASRLLFVPLQQTYVQIAMVFEPGLVTLDSQHTDSRKQHSALEDAHHDKRRVPRAAEQTLAGHRCRRATRLA